MAIEMKVPSPGESITRVQIAKWLVSAGDYVEKDQEVVEIDSDKASFPMAAPVAGVITLKAAEGDTIEVGAVIAELEESVVQPRTMVPTPSNAEESPPIGKKVPAEPPMQKIAATPLAKKVLQEKQMDTTEISRLFPGKKITRKAIESFLAHKTMTGTTSQGVISRDVERRKMSTLRLKLAERLVAVKNQTAMLTTFNEVNMQTIQQIRQQFGDAFKERYGVSLGYMSFFTKAVTVALNDFPQVNAMIEGDELILPGYADIGIAVSAPRGLVVPVLRNAERMSFAEIELTIRELAQKARENRLSIDEMKGGTFTITNGGVFGSLLSTPILNPPQSAILGMHKIEERPVAVKGEVVIAPMMYVALSYDHRVIDGRESVSFLVKVKELLEDPARLLTSGEHPIKIMLDL